MKTAHLISQYLLQNKKMRLQGFGEFTMEGFYENPFENEKGKVKVPDNTIHFKPDRKANEDESLVEFIAKSSGKIKPLAFSDLEDFLNIGKQLLNVSKQFYIEGLGTIILEGSGNMTFKQGNELIPAAVMSEHVVVENKQRDVTEEQGTDLSFQDTYATQKSGLSAKKLVTVLGIIAGIAVIAWGGYYFFTHWQNNSSTATPKDIKPLIPEQATAPVVDSAALKAAADSLNKVAVVQPAAQQGYRVIIENASRSRAFNRYEALLKMGYKVQMSTEDSISFKLFTVIDGPISDSSKVRDSISRFFGRRVLIEVQ